MPINYGNNDLTTTGVLTTGGLSSNNLNTSGRYSEKVQSISISSNTLTIDLNTCNLFTCSLNANITTLTLSNPPSGASMGFSLIFTADGTARSVTWPASVKWPANTAPTLTSTNNKKDVLSFLSTDNGTSWLGFVGGQDY